MFMRLRLASLSLLLVSALSASAESSPHWLQISTDHFIVSTDASDHDARHIAAQFERMRGLFNTILPQGGVEDSAPIVVLAFKNKKEFDAVEPSAYLAKNSLQLSGLFLRTPGRNYILLRLDAEGEHPFATVYHEYTHYVTRRAEWMPLWLSEGLAEFYQNTDIIDKDVRLGQPSGDDILYLRQNRLLPLATLFAVDHDSPYYHDEQKGSVFYAESWALVHYLMVSDAKQKTNRVHDYAVHLAQHEDPIVAAQHAFGDLKELQKALDSYVGQMSFSYFKTTSSVSVNEASLTVVPVTADAADATRADVLAYDGRPVDAKALAEGILKADPQSLLAHEAMGDICSVQQDRACARKWYAEAVKLNSQNPFVLFNYAATLVEDGSETNDAEIEADLKKSVELDSHFAPAYDVLARFYATRKKNETGARIAIVRAISLEPEQLMYRLNASSDWMAMDDLTNALAVLTNAKRSFHAPGDVAVLDQRIKQIKDYQASVSRNQTINAETAGRTTAIPPGSGKRVTLVSETTDEPEAKALPTESGAHHSANGVIHNEKCSYPTILTLELADPKHSLKLYSNNYYKVPFSTLNFKPEGDLDVCKQLEGMKARVEYADVTDDRVAGQIVAIELSK
jgi:Tfp pilus assembly protein PilF